MSRAYWLLVFVVVAAVAAECAETISLADLPKHATEESQLTLPDSPAFHLKAKVFESTDRHNDNHNAEIEEYWVSPDKWRREVKTANFSQTLVVNGNQTSEQITGDYYPNWLRTFVNAIFDPGARLQNVDLTQSDDTARLRWTSPGTLAPAAYDGREVCRRFSRTVGLAPATNNVFSTYCFRDGLIESVGVPGYDVDYGDYKKFDDKRIAHKLSQWVEPGTELGAKITNLTELAAPDPSLFVIDQPSANFLTTVILSEAALRGLAVNAPDIKWPPISSGKNPGTLSIYVCVDRAGRVRETYPLNSDNPFMTWAARQQAMNWRFQPTLYNGFRVQIESILTFAYYATSVPK
ncbi:MAG TPA: hypothetical protein VMB02_02650 [Candidatus Aquilonibacter sp.]|nr:hypothetical protein [Candidatus Aquilonibacter sp.]